MRRAVISILALMGAAACAVTPPAPSNNGASSPPPTEVISTTSTTTSPAQITLAEFDQIQKGMTYDQVVAIVGEPGQVQSEYGSGQYHSKTYEFQGATRNFMTGQASVTFQNGKVESKMQFGLV